MKIVQAIETSGPGGAEQVLLRLCGGLRALGHDVETLLLKEGWLADRLRDEGFPLTILPLAQANDRGFPARLRDHLDHCGADVLHTHEFTLAAYGRLACRRGPIGHVATAHGMNFLDGLKRRLSGTVLLRPRRRFALVAVSSSLSRTLGRRLLLGADAVRLIANGVVVPPTVTASTHTDDEPLRLLAVGNLYPVKNHGLLIRAVVALRERGVAAELDILGRGAEEARLARLIEELDVGDAVRLRGFRQDVDRFYDGAHVLVSSSLSEGMPLSFLEAMALGLPVVATRVGGVPEVVEDGVHGLLYPSGDVDAAVESLERLARDEALRARLGNQAAATVRAELSAERMVENYLGLYQQLTE